MRLFGKISGDLYEADLLIQDGFIIAATCENLEKGEMHFGRSALFRIIENFSKSRGRLDLYSFSTKEMEMTKNENLRALLNEKIPVEKIGIRIKPLQPKVIKESEDDAKGIFGSFSFQKQSLDEVKIKPQISMMDIKKEIQNGNAVGNTLIGKQISPSEVPKLFGDIKSVEGLDKKKNLIDSLREKRWIIDKEIAERISRFWTEKKEQPEEKEIEGKVKTTIDELYELVKENKVVKLNDALAKKLNVSRSQIESWAVILEEHNLIELHYPAIGEPEIRLVEKK